MKIYLKKFFFFMLAALLFAMPNSVSAEAIAPEVLRESVAAVLRSDRILIRGRSVNDRDYYTSAAENVRGIFAPGMRRQAAFDGTYDIFDFTWATDGRIYSIVAHIQNRVLEQKLPPNYLSYRKYTSVVHPDAVYIRYGTDGKVKKAGDKDARTTRDNSSFRAMARHLQCVLSPADLKALATKYDDYAGTSDEGIFKHKSDAREWVPDIDIYVGSGQETYKEKEYQYLEYQTLPKTAVAWTKRLYFLDGKLVKLVARRNSSSLSFADMMRPLNFRTSVSVSGFYVCDIDELTNDVPDEILDPLKDPSKRKLGFAQ